MKFDSDPEDPALPRSLADFFRLESESAQVAPSEAYADAGAFKQKEVDTEISSLLPCEGDLRRAPGPVRRDWPDSAELSGNAHPEPGVNNQMGRRAVSKLAKEMKKCSKDYFARVFGKRKKNVLQLAQQVSFSRDCAVGGRALKEVQG